MTHTLQQLIAQSPDLDVFSADAIKAVYSLNSEEIKSRMP